MNTPQCQCIDTTTPTRPNLLATRIKQVWQWLLHTLSTSYEPKVWQKVDRQGKIVNWQVFDPETGQKITFGSELEVRLWLEQRFYR